MKAIVIHQFGDPSVLNLEEVAQPTLEAGEIAIKVRAVTVNQTLDVALRAGKYARRPPLPHVPGSDAAGEVAAVAADVKTLKVGDRVVCPRSSDVNRTVFPDCWASTPGGLTPSS
jgi:NADPH:quinone reductase-like Zn-dependent oxidoreductase